MRDKINNIASANSLLRVSRTLENVQSFARRDEISHIMIRYACQNDYEKVFIEKESKLF